MGSELGEHHLLRSKGDATRYRLLVELAERQPSVSQRELADAIGVTSQAVSEYLADLANEGYVSKHGRGNYELTKEGVDWLITQTTDLREYITYVSEEVLGEVETEAALAADPIDAGDPVSLSMRDGVLQASREERGTATARALGSAGPGQDVAVTDFEGLLEFESGNVTIVAVPRAEDGGSRAVDSDWLRARADDCDLLAVAGVEAIAAVRQADLVPDLRFGTVEGVPAAAHRGLDVLLVAVTTAVAEHTGPLREGNLSYEVLEPRAG